MFNRGWEGENERMKEVWIYGETERIEKNKRSSEMVTKKESEWTRASDYIFEEDITSLLILCYYAEGLRRELNQSHMQKYKRRVLEMESM